MESSQIILYGLIAIVIFLYLRKFLLGKKFKNYSAGEVKAMLDKKEIILLDVRTESERSRNFIKGSIHIPLSSLTLSINELKKYNGKEIVCYCASGSRSLSACGILNKNGIKAANMLGGISRWNF